MCFCVCVMFLYVLRCFIMCACRFWLCVALFITCIRNPFCTDIHLPCLWLRGILPADLCLDHPIPPPPLVDDIVVFDPFSVVLPGGDWPPGLYGTDGSGGKWGGYTPLRRCGCRVSRLVGMDPPYQLQFGAHFPLVGEVQTVPRAELYAIFVVVKKVPYGTIMIVSDSKINVDMFYKSRMVALGFLCMW
jgi:hypothetical protein